MENNSKDPNIWTPSKTESIWPRLWRGMKLRCPRCGTGKLFRAYLKPVAQCSNCDKKWEHVRADLAPAWASMTIAAHVTVLVWHVFFWQTDMPNWQLTSILSVIATGICLIALPSMKGLFMAIIWAKRTTDS